jgi:signal transduction histidine kinase
LHKAFSNHASPDGEMTAAEHAQDADDNPAAAVPGDTDMHMRVPAHDWSQTPLGAIEHWSRELKTAVRVCLDEGFPHLVWGSDLIQIYNQPAINILRAKHPAAFGRPAREAWEEAWADVGPLAAHVFATGEPERREGFPLILNRDGSPDQAFFDFCYSGLRDDTGKVVGVFMIAIEITERVRTEAALREREAQLREANRAKDEFLAMLGQELRNPLQPIMTTLQLMQVRQPNALAEERGTVASQVMHLTAMVDDLLDVSRIARGKLELKTAPLDIGDIVIRALDTPRPMLEEQRQTVEKAIADDLVVEGDRRRLIQIFANLLTNAAKYSPPGRIVHLSPGAEGGDVVVRVRDEGFGIGASRLRRIFEAFTQDAQSIERTQGGLGLGLSIVHNLIQLHGGSVEARSEGRNGGAEFMVCLPLAQGQAAQAEAEPADRLPRHRAGGGTTKVLIIDDYVNAADSLWRAIAEASSTTAPPLMLLKCSSFCVTAPSTVGRASVAWLARPTISPSARTRTSSHRSAKA